MSLTHLFLQLCLINQRKWNYTFSEFRILLISFIWRLRLPWLVLLLLLRKLWPPFCALDEQSSRRLLLLGAAGVAKRGQFLLKWRWIKVIEASRVLLLLLRKLWPPFCALDDQKDKINKEKAPPNATVVMAAEVRVLVWEGESLVH